MKVHLYTNEEIKNLKSNMFVKDIKYKRTIEYTSLFKLWTIMMRYEFPELSAKEIFARAGFDVNILHKRIPQQRIKEWKDNYIRFGIRYFLPENEYYKSINYIKEKENTYDIMQAKIMNYVLKRLKELKRYDNR